MGMNEIELSPKGVVTWMVNGCGLSGATISASLGKERKYIHKYTSGGHIPTITVLAQIAAERQRIIELRRIIVQAELRLQPNGIGDELKRGFEL